MAKRTPVGELRPTQLLHTFGVGSVVDLPNVSAMVMGLDDWDVVHCRAVYEERLLAAVRRQLGAQVEQMVLPPMPPEDQQGFFPAGDAASLVGVPVVPFPSTMRCPRCDRIGRRVRGVFDLKVDPYRPDRTRYVHTNCQRQGKSPPTILPTRFIVACARGHIDEFPWVRFVHGGPTDCSAALSLREMGASGEAVDVEVRCLGGCPGAFKRMSEAFGQEGLSGYKCRGRRPHLRDFDEGCEEKPKAILLGASNSWFGVTLSALYVPPTMKDRLDQLVEEHWGTLQHADAPNVISFMRKRGELAPFASFEESHVWAAVERRRAGQDDEEGDALSLKEPEWRVFANPAAAPQNADFRLSLGTPPPRFAKEIESVVLVERLREVTALTGFTRIAAPVDLGDALDEASAHRVPLSRRPPTFVPASEVRGEGIFLRFAEERVKAWCAETLEREAKLFEAHRRWRRARKIQKEAAGFPGYRFVLLHSFSHALMRQLALECGYTAASIRERIYARNPEEDGGAMAGVLIYTAAPDSEGTLGGLVSLGQPEQLGRHIDQALEQMRLCASDPLCAEHLPEADGTPVLHCAACHACLFAPETSCERGNKYLDRTVLVDTVSTTGIAFFGGSVGA